jgi:proline iminopeptidase
VAPGGQPWATLGLAYAETSPERVSALVLRGIFLCRPWEIRWFYQQGANLLFPDHWQDLVAPIPEAERDDLVHAYHRRLTGTDDSVLRDAALAGSIWEGRCATLLPDAGVRGAFADDRIARSLPRIECHYFVNDAFLTPDQLL